MSKPSTAPTRWGKAGHQHQGGSGGGWRRWRTLVGCNFASYHNWTKCDTKIMQSKLSKRVIFPFQQLLSWEESSVRILVHFVSARCLRKEALSARSDTRDTHVWVHWIDTFGFDFKIADAFRRHLRTVAQFFGLKIFEMTWLDDNRIRYACTAPNFPLSRAEQAELEAPHNLQSVLLPKPLSEFGLIYLPPIWILNWCRWNFLLTCWPGFSLSRSITASFIPSETCAWCTTSFSCLRIVTLPCTVT